MTRTLHHLRRNAVAYLALFLALTSTGYAASTKLLPKNSVASAQVVNGSLLKADLSKRAVAQLRGRTGPQGPIGLRGPSGPGGVVTSVDSAPAGMCAYPGGACQVAGPFASCPTGSVAVGGGWQSDSIDLVVSYARRSAGPNYAVIAINYDSVPRTITAQVICASGETAAAQATTASTASFQRVLSETRAAVGH